MNEEKPFDAQEFYLCDRERDPDRRRTVSLVTAIRHALEKGRDSSPDGREFRLEAVKAAAEELTRRGLDATSLVRYGMWRHIAGSLVMSILSRQIADIRVGSLVDDDGFDFEGWRRVLGVPETLPIAGSTPGGVERLSRMVAEMLDPLTSWISAASLEDLVLLRPPTEIHLLTCSDTRQDQELQDRYGWAVDHFSETFFQDWETCSLHLAHRWLDGREVAPCAAELMRDRVIDRAKLNDEIAKRAVSREREPVSERLGAVRIRALTAPGESDKAALSARILEPEMVNHACRLLQEGRCLEAAAIFEFAVQGIPDNPSFHNNWGFCLIPVEPDEALEHLTRAADLGYDHRALNIHNQMCCLLAAGRPMSALQLADRHWPLIREQLRGSVTIWKRRTDATWTLTEADDARVAVAELAAELALGEGRSEDEQLWKARANFDAR